MVESLKTWGIKKFFFLILIFLIATDLAILLNIPFLRQILGFLFLTFLPGLLILQILKLNKIGSTEKFVLVVGLSISFLMFFGLLINNLSLSLGYLTPLSTISLLISFNLAIITLAIIGYKLNKNSIFSLPSLELTTSEKAFLIVPTFFPALSIFGMHLMNTTGNNIILMLMLFLIPIYVAFVCFFNQKFPKRLYPIVIFLTSISLLLLMSLRSNHIIGADTHVEYYLFQITFDDLHWHSLRVGNQLDACLSVSILPTIYQSILNINPEFLFKILYSLIVSILPLVIYVLSKRYVGELYGFLTSCFFMFQSNFLWTAPNARTNTAILFFALAMMTLFNDKVDPLKKRILFIVFIVSCMVSHYSTTYIFLFIMLGSFLGIEILSKKYTFKKVISLTIVVIFFALIFFWYSQVTETAFNAGMTFIENTLSNLNKFFVAESKGGQAQALFGEGITEKGIPHKIEYVFSWLTIAFIAIGIITLIRRYKELSFPELKFEKPEFLKDKFEVTYFIITLVCAGLLVVVIALPYVTVGYNLQRSYTLGIVILSIFFVIGGIVLSKQTFKKSSIKNKSKVRAYLVILLVLIPYFFCVTGVMYNIFGVPRAITLNSEGEQYDMLYVHDQESCGAKWMGMNAEKNINIYTTGIGKWYLMSQAKIAPSRIDIYSFPKRKVNGYIYLYYDNMVEGKIVVNRQWCNMTEYSDRSVGTNKIYSSGGSEIYKT